MKKLILIILAIFILSGCTKEMTEIEKILDENNYIIVDVRTEEEYNQGHVKNSINIPYDVIGEYEFDKDKMILVYCKSGKRSSIAFNTLIEAGYNVYDLGAYQNIDLPKE